MAIGLCRSSIAARTRCSAAFGVLLVGNVLLSCTAPHVPQARPAAARGHQLRGWSLNPPAADADAAIVRVETEAAACTGALVAPSLVLTAHHCVAARDDQGLRLAQDLPPSAVEVALGGGDIPCGKVGVRAIVAPPCGYRSGHGDIAVLVLVRPLVGIPTLPIRLDGPPGLGRTVHGVGFGTCSPHDDHSLRVSRPGGAVERIGVGAFYVSASTCPGDSGGPVRDSNTGDVVGVVSASEMDEDDGSRDPTFYTRIDVWRALFTVAEGLAHGATRAELPPIEGCALDP